MSPDETQQQNTTGISTDHKHHLLSSRRRRQAVAILDTHGPMDKGELADRIAAREVDDVTSQARKRVYVALHQCHLPKLADHGVIEDRPDGIRLGPNADALLPHVEYVPAFRRASSFVRNAV